MNDRRESHLRRPHSPHAVVDAARSEASLGDLEAAALAEDAVLKGNLWERERDEGEGERKGERNGGGGGGEERNERTRVSKTEIESGREVPGGNSEGGGE